MDTITQTARPGLAELARLSSTMLTTTPPQPGCQHFCSLVGLWPLWLLLVLGLTSCGVEHRVGARTDDPDDTQTAPSSGGRPSNSDSGGAAGDASDVAAGAGAEPAAGGVAPSNSPNTSRPEQDAGATVVAETDAGVSPVPPECATDAECEDGIKCTVDSCDSVGQFCSVRDECECDEDANCDDGIACTRDVCDPLTRSCETVDECDCADDTDCDDGIACTLNTCDLASRVCVLHNDCECLDDLACEVSSNPCVSASCNPATRTCSVDISACECSPETAARDCDDTSPCTNDACIDFACVSTPRTGERCDDEIACTAGDICQPDGSCVGNDAACKAPPAWSCAQDLYANGQCDCGCGAVDFDCSSNQAAACTACHCSVCSSFDGCGADCPVDPNDNAVCAWTCADAWYRDSECDCGCGLRDPDCQTAASDECVGCWCEGAVCAFTDATLAFCSDPLPPAWECSANLYGDAACDCGCGAPDPSCLASESSCASCSCLDNDCAFVDEAQGVCAVPLPETWHCELNFYGDGDCDRGCGDVDIDCASVGSSCEFCFCRNPVGDTCPVSTTNTGICTN